MKQHLVISAINLTSGGPLSVLEDSLEVLSERFTDRFHVTALVHSRELGPASGIEYIEFPKSKGSWFRRMYYEFFAFRKLSRQLKPDHWLSLHDITPNVVCPNRYVYCHNPAPFYQSGFADLFVNPKVYLFSKFYIYLYGINIRKNRFLFVQQDWIRQAFRSRWGLENIVVAHPEVADISREFPSAPTGNPGRTVFFFPSFPRPFKNFEAACQAYADLPESYRSRSELRVTISEELNSYTRDLHERFGQVPGIRFLGLLTRKEVYQNYAEADCMIFPSKLETWGYPITEFKQTGKPLFLSDLPYAHETLGTYERAKFFDPGNPASLTTHMKALIDGTIQFEPQTARPIDPPHVTGWEEFFEWILKHS